MSRRTKYIIAALFLVLLTIPVVYLVLTWSPANPLRFRVEPSTYPDTAGDFQVVIENTSSVTVEVQHFWASFHDDLPPGAPRVSRRSGCWVEQSIAPGASLRTSWIVPPLALQTHKGAHWVEYHWRSHAQYTTQRIIDWLTNPLPAYLRHRVPSVPPNLDLAPTPTLPKLEPLVKGEGSQPSPAPQ